MTSRTRATKAPLLLRTPARVWLCLCALALFWLGGCTRAASRVPSAVPALPEQLTPTCGAACATPVPAKTRPPTPTCGANCATPVPANTAQPTATCSAGCAAAPVTIDQVQVSPGQGIYVQGHTTLPNGECVKTDLLAGGQPLAWWPRNTCIQVDSGQWEILTPLGQNGAPQTLAPSGHYTLQAWWSKQPEQTATHLPFTPNP